MRCAKCRSAYWDRERENGSTVGREPRRADDVRSRDAVNRTSPPPAEMQERPIPTKPAHAPTCKCDSCKAEKAK